DRWGHVRLLLEVNIRGTRARKSEEELRNAKKPVTGHSFEVSRCQSVIQGTWSGAQLNHRDSVAWIRPGEKILRPRKSHRDRPGDPHARCREPVPEHWGPGAAYSITWTTFRMVN